MLTIVYLRNPFNPSAREIVRRRDVDGVRPLVDYVRPPEDGAEWRVAINGGLVEWNQAAMTRVRPGDFVALCPVVAGGGGGGGKNPIAAIAGLALMAVSFGVGGLVAGTWNFASWGVGAWLAAGATMFLGGQLIESKFGGPKPNLDTGNFSAGAAFDNGHEWGKLSPVVGQGGPVPITFGTIRTAGTVLAQHVRSDGANQYLELLLCGGEGPVDSIDDVRVNDNPIVNYDITPEIRLGTNDQTVIAGFSDTYADQALSYELSRDDWTIHQVDSNAAQGLEVTLEFPQGLYYVHDSGDAGNTTVRVILQYQADSESVGGGGEGGTEEGTWHDLLPQIGDGYNVEIVDNKRSAIRRTFGIPGLPPDRYNVRAKIVFQGSTGDVFAGTYQSRYVDTCRWSQLTSIIYDDFERPNKVLLGVTALATDKLSGSMPAITWRQTRANVWVWVPGSSAYVTKPATNPAWAAYDLIHKCRHLHDIRDHTDKYVVFGEPHTRIDYTAFKAWADWCDEQVDVDGYGTMVARCSINLYIDAATTVWEAVQRVASAGRGVVVLRGTQYSALHDGESDPVQLFTMGNIISGSFQGEYLSTRERANAIEISFLNEAKGFQRDSLIVYGDNYDANTDTANPTQVFLHGITNYYRAVREGRYRLRLNKYLLRSISFKADIDAIACQPGDVINVQHDVPRWGEGGRVVAAATCYLTIDRAVTLLPAKSYQLMVRLGDDTISTWDIAAVGVSTTTSVLTLTETMSPMPEKFDLYAVGEVDKVTKPFRLLSVRRSGTLQCELRALEYRPEVYTDNETVPDVDYTVSVPTVADLRIGFFFDLTGAGYLSISWTPPRGSYGGALVVVNGRASARVPATEYDAVHRITNDGTYSVKVVGLDLAGGSTGSIDGTVTVAAMSIPTVDSVTASENTYVSKDGTVLTDLALTMVLDALVDYPYFIGVDIYLELDGDGNWKPMGRATSTRFVIKSVPTKRGSTTYRIKVCAVNRWNIQGAPLVTDSALVVGKNALPATVGAITVTVDQLNRCHLKLSWPVVDEPDIAGYEVRVGGTSWDAATRIDRGLVADAAADYFAAAGGSFTFRVKAIDTSGQYSQLASVLVTSVAVEPAEVTRFQAVQNGTQVMMSWDQLGDADVVDYEIREGPSFALGMLVASNIAAGTWQTNVDNERLYTFWIKARTAAGFYSATAAKASVNVSGLPVRNVIESFDEIALDDGTSDGNADIVATAMTWGIFPGRWSDYSSTNWDDAGNGNVLRATLTTPRTSQYTGAQRDMGKVISATISCAYRVFILKPGASVRLQFRIGLTADTATWSEWADFVPNLATFRYVQFRVLIDLGTADDPVSPEVTEFVENVDVPDIFKAGGPVAISAGGTDVAFGFTFYSPPTAVATAIGAAVYAEIVPASVTETQFRVRVRDAAGTDVGGNINWMARGY